MSQSIASIALVVKDYDDTPLTKTKRWVLVSPRGSNGTNLLLAKADSPEQENHIGNQTGGRVYSSFYIPMTSGAIITK